MRGKALKISKSCHSSLVLKKMFAPILKLFSLWKVEKLDEIRPHSMFVKDIMIKQLRDGSYSILICIT